MNEQKPTILQRLGRAELAGPAAFLGHVTVFGLSYTLMAMYVAYPLLPITNESAERNPVTMLVAAAVSVVPLYIGIGTPIAMMTLNRRLRTGRPMEITTLAITCAVLLLALAGAASYALLAGASVLTVFCVLAVALHALAITACGLWAWNTGDWEALLPEEQETPTGGPSE